MAILDSRLTPLIDTLAAVGADWLAFELMDGIRQGRVTEETPDALAKARQSVRQENQPVHEPASIEPEQQPILGDDQIEWATHYVSNRLGATVKELAASLDNLDAIIDQRAEEAPVTSAGDAVSLVIVFTDVEDQEKIDQRAVEQARADLQALRNALEEWSTQVRGTPQT